jgi:hypothetical protein
MPVEVTDSLVPNPSGFLRTRTVSDLALIIGAVAYVSIYAYIIINYFRKADLKT